MNLYVNKITLIFYLILLFSSLLSCTSDKSVNSIPRGTVRFDCEPIDASLEIDETRMGPVGMFKDSGVLLKTGDHRIIVEKEGFFKEYRLINVGVNSVQVVKISLKSVPF
ncbi:MAG: hypothetical protein JXR91_00790 [Deltaproteobacteria bacterium]|nr:hypothetical protein [Deltaproteobacteria bacterium]